MFRNQYDTDVTTFSPAGRLHQVEYAVEAVKQGSCSVGLRNNQWAVVASLKRSNSELASYQQKVFKVDEHMGIAISGLVSDARVLAQWLRNECLNHRFVYQSAVQTERLVIKLSDKSQVYTQKAEKRPYGVGLLVVGADKTGTHLFQTDPSGLYYEYIAQAIGARSQSSRTYLEKIYEKVDTFDRNEIIRQALHALKGASQKKLTSRNVSVGIVGVDGKPFVVLEGEEIRTLVGEVTHEDDADEEEKKEESEAVVASASSAEEEQKKKADEEEEQAARAAAEEEAREEMETN